MPPTFLLFALFFAGAYVCPPILLAGVVLVARRTTRALGRQLLTWSFMGAGAFFALLFLTARPPIFIEDTVGVTAGGFTAGAVSLLVWRRLTRRQRGS